MNNRRISLIRFQNQKCKLLIYIIFYFLVTSGIAFLCANNQSDLSVSLLQQSQQQQQQYLSQQDVSFRYDEHRLCSICIDQCLPEERILVLPCRHVFHSECVRALREKNCPNCRIPF
ncbi:C3HC4 type (RING finger) zinc finger protein (macronuclear) [Tetrahymena thermophila SB210]|uniref:C3HC4 type (RING finger) zinc finger protein n=1 Tax=Tetrahymena thermophila (strain SB210) TaxID=312017 RepID=W7XJM0_TETTS|nr:C3HC4 type (RING finger) zinc finger protein [Tetrahymena thermophila SB210]EWS74264.1 C3HC4 type (RING finger) zinc finger protein [Tetrahymena thermophila SB210]|eukprot:XP_012653237.1 C3HC4 type (RING finger) zinc finger protein [Tetrahymena thermophila SB210]